MIGLLDKLVETQEEQNEILREHTQLLGDVLSSLDRIGNGNVQPVVNVGSGGTNIDASHVTNVVPQKATGPVPPPDADALLTAQHGSPADETLMIYPEHDVYWPKMSPKAVVPDGWVRVTIEHKIEDSLSKRLRKGCLCGQRIVLKEHNNSSFYTCEALTQKGSCPYRPTASYEKLTFTTNLPPQR